MINRVSFSKHDERVLKTLSSPGAKKKGSRTSPHILVQKPWGHEYLLYENSMVAAWLLYIHPNARTSMHCHPNKTTAIILLSGTAVCMTLTDSYRLSCAGGMHLEKGVFHTTQSTEEEGIYVMEVETPVNKFDLIRFEDVYGREHLGYESGKHLIPRIREKHYSFLDETRNKNRISKQIGSCRVDKITIKDEQEFFSIVSADQPGIITLLRGKIVNGTRNHNFAAGAVMSIDELRKMKHLSLHGPIELLYIHADAKGAPKV